MQNADVVKQWHGGLCLRFMLLTGELLTGGLWCGLGKGLIDHAIFPG